MIIFTPIFESELKEKPILPKYDGVKMTIEEFQNWNPEIESGIKYEWNEGILEATDKLKPQETKIYSRLHSKFIKNSKLVESYEIIAEVESHLISQKKIRIPDIGIFSKKDIENFQNGKSFIPVLAIEIISPTNQSEEMELKVKEYLIEGVKSVWCIFPRLKEVRIYNSPKQVKICTDSDICDAGDVIPDFQITVDEIFG